MRRFFLQCLSCLIVLEVVITGLGFCGHYHTHIDSPGRGFVHTADVHKGGHYDVHDEGGSGCRGEPLHCMTDYHCPCLGGFIGELQVVFIGLLSYSESYNQLQPDDYKYVWSPLIFHPPQ